MTMIASMMVLNPVVSIAQELPELVAVPMNSSQSTLPNIGGESGGLSWVEERELGDQISYLLQQDFFYERDPLLHDYVNNIWMRLLQAARRSGELSEDLYQRMAWQMYLVRDPSVNAFALPGAYIGVNLGLISVVETQDELASVLAHESVHIFQRHIGRLYGASSEFSALSIASAIVGILAMGVDPNLGGAIFMGGGAAAAQGQINFTRTMEYEADRIGYKVLTAAGYRPQGMAEMFDRLAQASRYYDTTSFPYLRTHPLTDARIAEAQLRLGLADSREQAPVDLLQNLMSARATVLSRNKPDALREILYRGYDRTGNVVIAQAGAWNLYAATLAAIQLLQFDKADLIWDQLLAVTQNDSEVLRVVYLLGIEAAVEEGDAGKAQARLAQLEGQSMPWLERTELFLSAQTALISKDPAKAVALLQPWIFSNANDEQGWSLLTRAYRENGQPLLALRAEAESRMAIGDFDGAVDRFNAALKYGEAINASVYDMELLRSRLISAQNAQSKRHEF